MRSSILCLLLSAAALVAAPSYAQVARPSDKAVGAMISGVQKSVRQFQKSLPSEFKRATLKGATADVKVENYLEDFATDIERLQGRFKPEYSASADVVEVLHKGSKIDEYVRAQPPSFKGRSEWDAAAAQLKQLAVAYETTFPTLADATARRINDKEIQVAAQNVSKDSKAFRKALSGAFTKEEAAALQAVQKSTDALAKAAEALRSRSASGKPSSGEAGVVAEAIANVEKTLAGRTLPTNATAVWDRVKAAAKIIEQAYRPAAV